MKKRLLITLTLTTLLCPFCADGISTSSVDQAPESNCHDVG